MIKQERHARICEYLDKHQFASINTLMEQIGASKSTVRRDLMELQEEKKIAFVRGGAASTNQQFVQESPYHVKQSTNTAEKERIGAAAAQLVQTGETIFLASGTTTRAVLPGLSEVDLLNLVTNELQIAMDARRFGMESWIAILCSSLLLGLGGLFALSALYSSFLTPSVAIGIALGLDGLQNAWITMHTVRVRARKKNLSEKFGLENHEEDSD